MTEQNHLLQLPNWVLVNAGLRIDPVNKQGEIGVITAAIVNADEFYVGFTDKVVGLYASDALQVLNDRESIYQYLTDNENELGKASFTALLNIVLLQDYGSSEQYKRALTLAHQHPEIKEIALISLESQMQKVVRSTRPGR